MKIRNCAAIAVCLAAPIVASAAPTIQIDSFSDATPGVYPFTLNTIAGPGLLGADSPISSAIGGARRVAMQTQTLDLPGLDSVTAGVFAGGPGILDYNATAGADGLALAIYGDFQSLMPALNIAVPNGSYAKVDLYAFDLPAGGNLQLKVRVESTGVGVADSSLVIVTTGGAQSILIPLDAVPAAFRANVTNLVFSFDGTTAADFRIDNLSIVVPEPASFGLLAPAGLLLARRRRA
jgi:hypothetical protein